MHFYSIPYSHSIYNQLVFIMSMRWMQFQTNSKRISILFQWLTHTMSIHILQHRAQIDRLLMPDMYFSPFKWHFKLLWFLLFIYCCCGCNDVGQSFIHLAEYVSIFEPKTNNKKNQSPFGQMNKWAENGIKPFDTHTNYWNSPYFFIIKMTVISRLIVWILLWLLFAHFAPFYFGLINLFRFVLSNFFLAILLNHFFWTY